MAEKRNDRVPTGAKVAQVMSEQNEFTREVAAAILGICVKRRAEYDKYIISAAKLLAEAEKRA